MRHYSLMCAMRELLIMMSKVGQLFFIGIQGTDLSDQEVDFIVTNNIGGVVLFDRNIESPEQLFRLCTEIQSLQERMVEKLPLFIGIDMEGGRVHRLKPPFTQWPALKMVGDLDSTTLAFKFAQAMGRELSAIGINLDFAPCVDINTNPKNPVIGDRALGDTEALVSKLSSALVRGYIKSGLITCAKHFPGHGNTGVDSHLELPVEELTLEELNKRELLPFKKIFRARLDLVMTGHLMFKNIDPDNPVTFSKTFLKKILRDEIHYQGLVISDDLDMKALASHHSAEEIPVKALLAGCDLLLYCNEFEKPPIAIAAVERALKDHTLSMAQIDSSYQKIIKLKSTRLTNRPVTNFTDAMKVIGCEEHLKLSKDIQEGQLPENLKST